MKARVLKTFRDKDNFAQIYDVDSIIELTRDRYQGLKALGLVEEVRERVKQPDKNTDR